MTIRQVQIKINLSSTLKDFLESKAQKYDISIASYVKHLILKDVSEMEYPTFEASERTLKAYEKARQEKKEGKFIRVTDVKKFFDEL
ncbi:MAG TPA: hypothetical protein VF185_03865 [Patescibacteria group bacterium]